MGASASFAWASGKVSIMGRTPVAAAKRRGSSESFACPLGHPCTDWRRRSRAVEGRRIGSGTPATRSTCPLGPRPVMMSSIAAAHRARRLPGRALRGVDVLGGAELLGERTLVGAARHGDRAEAHAARELHPEM